MTTPRNILIVGNCPEALELRAAMLAQGATVHVVTIPAARILARRKHVDTAFVMFSMDKDTSALCATFVQLGIKFVYFSAGSSGGNAKLRLRATKSEIVVPSAA